MIGIVFAIVSAFLYACGDIGKKRLSETNHPFVVTWVPVTIGVVLGAAFFIAAGLPSFDLGETAPLAAISAGILVLVELSFIRSISTAEISLVMPLTAFAPVTAGLTAWAVSGESPHRGALLGIIVILTASWLMFADTADWRHLVRPFKKMFATPSARAMLIFCVLNGLFVNLMNKGSEHTSPTLFLWLVLFGEWLILTILMLARGIDPLAAFRTQPLLAAGTGIFWAGGMTCLFEALSLTMVAYAMAANRVHTVFIVFLSHWILRERDFGKRLFAALLMVIGVAILISSDLFFGIPV